MQYFLLLFYGLSVTKSIFVSTMEHVETFEDYLISKKIDGPKFKAGDDKLYTDLKVIFDQMNPKSFTQQKLFLINPLRIKYFLVEEHVVSTSNKPKAAFKPKIRK